MFNLNIVDDGELILLGPVTITNYQERAMRTLGPHNDITYLTMGLIGEVGEVIDYAKKVIYHGHTFDPEKLAEELGDVLWYAAALCYNQGVDFVDILQSEYLLHPFSHSVKDEKLNAKRILNLSRFSGLCNLFEGDLFEPLELLMLVHNIKEIGLSAGIPFDHILECNIRKLQKRYPKGYTNQSSIKRKDVVH